MLNEKEKTSGSYQLKRPMNKNPIKPNPVSRKEKLRVSLNLPPNSDKRDRFVTQSEPVSPLRKMVSSVGKRAEKCSVIGLGPIFSK